MKTIDSPKKADARETRSFKSHDGMDMTDWFDELMQELESGQLSHMRLRVEKFYQD